MTSSPQDAQEQWFELSFVLDGRLERVALRSTSPNALDEITASVERATRGYIPETSASIKSFSVIKIMEEPITGTATSLLDTLREATGMEDDFGSPESEQSWRKLENLAARIDMHSQDPGATLLPVEVGFVWDNGGSEDNAFEDGFCCASTPDARDVLLPGFLDMLGEWGKGEDLWYDYYYNPAPSLGPLEGRMGLDHFKSWVEENEESLPSFMQDMVDDISRHETVIEMEQSLGDPRPRPLSGRL